MTSRFDDPELGNDEPGDDADDFLREVAHVDDIAPPSRHPLPGQTLGRFRILSELGRGGMGIVYLAHDENLRRAVALKLLSPSLSRKDERTRRFLREARAAASVTHPNLATIYDVGEVEGNIFIAMERVEGRTLRKVLAGGRPSIEQVIDIATQILAGLAKAHLAGVIHRDLKPDNIMLTDDGVVKLLDFGLAKRHDGTAGASEPSVAAASAEKAPDSAPRDTGENQLLGTPGYMSPEQVRNGSVDPRSDIFAFGVVFYEMLAGERPFRGQSHADLASAILRDTPRRLGELRPEVPQQLERLVERCLEKDPARRYPSSGALAIALAQLDLVGAARFATPPGSTPSPEVVTSTSGASAPVAGSRSLLRRLSERTGAVAKVAATVLVVLLAGLYFRGRGESDFAADLAEAERDVAEAKRNVAASRRQVTETTRELAAAAALAARAVPTPVTELPLPPSKSPDALIAYKAALQGIRDGNWGYVESHLERAVALDPGLAMAHLRLAMVQHGSPLMRPRAQFALALAGRASLSERDQALLHAFEPVLYRDPPDQKEHFARLRAATERFPGDAELFGILGWEQTDPDQKLAASRRAVELDPQYADGWQGVGAGLFQLGKTDEALAALDRCVALSPATADCSAQRGFLHASEGRCSEADEDFRRAVSVSTNGMWQDGRAFALFARGGAPEAVVEVFRSKWAQLSEDEKNAAERLDRANLDIATGNFQAAERETLAARAIVSSDAEANTHSRLALQLMEIYNETNRPREASRVAENYLKLEDAWIRSHRSDEDSISMYWAMFRAKSLSRDAFLEKRGSWVQAHASDPMPIGALSSYACGVETAEEAREALELFPNVKPPMVVSDKDFGLAMLGKLYTLVGRADEAVPMLERTVKSCYALMAPILHTRAAYHLGLALEASGDREAACGAYASVLARWGNAKPASVTAAKARERSRYLRCNAAPAARRAG
jgi:serine/threonine protein kinase/tetratricopeptide (TPR) repeat protein